MSIPAYAHELEHHGIKERLNWLSCPCTAWFSEALSRVETIVNISIVLQE